MAADPIDTFVIASIYLLRFLSLAILARVLLSWVDPNPWPTNAFKRALFTVTDPILEPLRRVIPPLGMIDISPMVALIVIRVLEEALRGLVQP